MMCVNTLAEIEYWPSQRFTVIGKGPSLEAVEEIEGWCVTLNHAIEVVGSRVNYAFDRCIAHFIDLEALLACEAWTLASARWIMMPWVPNEKMHQCGKSLAELKDQQKYWAIRVAERTGRLLVYNRLSSKNKLGGCCTADPRYFSSEAVLGVLGACGVKKVTLHGIDGGREYAPSMKHLTPGENNQPFDKQFPGLRKIRDFYNMEVENLL